MVIMVIKDFGAKLEVGTAKKVLKPPPGWIPKPPELCHRGKNGTRAVNLRHILKVTANREIPGNGERETELIPLLTTPVSVPVPANPVREIPVLSKPKEEVAPAAPPEPMTVSPAVAPPTPAPTQVKAEEPEPKRTEVVETVKKSVESAKSPSDTVECNEIDAKLESLRKLLLKLREEKEEKNFRKEHVRKACSVPDLRFTSMYTTKSSFDIREKYKERRRQELLKQAALPKTSHKSEVKVSDLKLPDYKINVCTESTFIGGYYVGSVEAVNKELRASTPSFISIPKEVKTPLEDKQLAKTKYKSETKIPSYEDKSTVLNENDPKSIEKNRFTGSNYDIDVQLKCRFNSTESKEYNKSSSLNYNNVKTADHSILEGDNSRTRLNSTNNKSGTMYLTVALSKPINEIINNDCKTITESLNTEENSQKSISYFDRKNKSFDLEITSSVHLSGSENTSKTQSIDSEKFPRLINKNHLKLPNKILSEQDNECLDTKSNIISNKFSRNILTEIKNNLNNARSFQQLTSSNINAQNENIINTKETSMLPLSISDSSKEYKNNFPSNNDIYSKVDKNNAVFSKRNIKENNLNDTNNYQNIVENKENFMKSQNNQFSHEEDFVNMKRTCNDNILATPDLYNFHSHERKLDDFCQFSKEAFPKSYAEGIGSNLPITANYLHSKNLNDNCANFKISEKVVNQKTYKCNSEINNSNFCSEKTAENVFKNELNSLNANKLVSENSNSFIRDMDSTVNSDFRNISKNGFTNNFPINNNLVRKKHNFELDKIDETPQSEIIDKNQATLLKDEEVKHVNYSHDDLTSNNSDDVDSIDSNGEKTIYVSEVTVQNEAFSWKRLLWNEDGKRADDALSSNYSSRRSSYSSNYHKSESLCETGFRNSTTTLDCSRYISPATKTLITDVKKDRARYNISAALQHSTTAKNSLTIPFPSKNFIK